MKNVMVTGGSGFIGTNLIIKLKEQGYNVINIDKNKPKVDVKTEYVEFTDFDFDFLKKYNNIDYVVHLAALSSPRICEGRNDVYDINVKTTEKFLRELNKKNIKKIIYMSSVCVYSDDAQIPIKEDSELDINKNEYAHTKGITEQICLDFIEKNSPIIAFRLSNVYGPFQNWDYRPTLIPQLIKQSKEGLIEVMCTSPIRDWVYIDDVVNAIIKGFDSKFNGILNLAKGEGFSVGEIAKEISKISGAKIIDLKAEARKPYKVICDISKIKKVLKWKPNTEITKGLKRTYDFYIK